MNYLDNQTESRWQLFTREIIIQLKSEQDVATLRSIRSLATKAINELKKNKKVSR